MTRIRILDMTLRAGELSAGAAMTSWEKLRIAEELDQLGVDVIEIGGPCTTPEDFDSIRRVASDLRHRAVSAVCRPTRVDIQRTIDALSPSEHPRLHTFLPASDLQLRAHNLTREQCIDRVYEAVSHARTFMDDVELGAEDAARADVPFLCLMVEAAIRAGASAVNLADSVGYAVPEDFARILTALSASVQGLDRVTVSVRCHDDLGLAVANSLAAVRHGARQVVCALNGIGPRAGSAALEEVVMALHVRPDLGSFETAVRTQRLHPASQLVAHITGIRPHANKAVVGEHAFDHETGQNGSETEQEILTPEMVGIRGRRLVLGRRSTRSAMVHRLRELGYELEPDRVEGAYEMFQMLAATKKTVLDEDLLAIYYQGTLDDVPKRFRLDHLHVVCGRRPARATVRIRDDEGHVQEASAEGDGPIDATFAAIQEVIPWEARLESFGVQAATPGPDALAEAYLHLRVSGHVFSGRAASTNIVDAAARAFLNAVDKAAHTRHLEARALERAEYWGV